VKLSTYPIYEYDDAFNGVITLYSVNGRTAGEMGDIRKCSSPNLRYCHLYLEELKKSTKVSLWPVSEDLPVKANRPIPAQVCTESHLPISNEMSLLKRMNVFASTPNERNGTEPFLQTLGKAACP
jgi:hypothetical protein